MKSCAIRGHELLVFDIKVVFTVFDSVPGETPLQSTEGNFTPDTAPSSGAMNDTLIDTGADSLDQCGPGPLQSSGQEPSPTPRDNLGVKADGIKTPQKTPLCDEYD